MALRPPRKQCRRVEPRTPTKTVVASKQRRTAARWKSGIGIRSVFRAGCDDLGQSTWHSQLLIALNSARNRERVEADDDPGRAPPSTGSRAPSDNVVHHQKVPGVSLAADYPQFVLNSPADSKGFASITPYHTPPAPPLEKLVLISRGEAPKPRKNCDGREEP